MQKILKISAVFLILVVGITFLIPFVLPSKFSFWTTDYAIFVGGVAGPLSALLGFIFIYLSFNSQQRQLDEQRNRLNKEEASKEFSEYFNLWNEFRAKAVYTWDNQSGSKAFDSYWMNVRKAVKGDALKDEGFDLMDTKAVTERLIHHLTTSSFNKTGQYEDFLRMIYPLLEMAERSHLDSKLKYLENLLSNGEKAILIYSASFKDKKEFAMNLFKNGFCRNIDDGYLITTNHKKLIF